MLDGWHDQALEGPWWVIVLVCFAWDSRAVFVRRTSELLEQPCVSDGGGRKSVFLCFCVVLVSSFRKEETWKEEGRTGRNERLRKKRRKGR